MQIFHISVKYFNFTAHLAVPEETQSNIKLLKLIVAKGHLNTFPWDKKSLSLKVVVFILVVFVGPPGSLKNTFVEIPCCWLHRKVAATKDFMTHIINIMSTQCLDSNLKT